MGVAEIGCKKCTSPDCKGCNTFILETALKQGKFDTLMDGNRTIHIAGEYNRYHGELDVRNGKLTIYGSDRCVCCGAIVPEGTQVCPTCIRKAET